MSIDLEKLTPAPLHAGGAAGYYDYATFSAESGLVGCFLKRNEADFHALARNAFDVMMRRRWAATPWSPNEKWGLDPEIFSDNRTEANTQKFIDWIYRNVFDDPFTALVEADRWYRENVEQKT